MCGIVGWIAFDEDLTQQRAIAEAMTATMACRGPDDAGMWTRPHVVLGHRRLAVIDPEGGRQPMTAKTPGGAVTLVYSGETYNFTQLRDLLRGMGHNFVTSSDTEVVLRGYLEWGVGVVDRLIGMFAFAIWDELEDRLLLVRDRLGVKPLYYYPTADGVLFGSEPKAILANPRVPRVVRTAGLRELFGFTMPPDFAFWDGMHEVPPGTVVTVDRTGIRTRTYWRLPLQPHEDDRDTTVATVRELLTDIVYRQLVADVPRSVLLSGGLDSSAITGLAAAHLPDPVRTFSVDFAGREETFQADASWDAPDTPFIRDVCTLVGSVHQTVTLNPHDLSDPALRRAVITARDIPTGLGEMDTSLYLLFKAVRSESTVALSGESADEVFGGYRWFHDPAALSADTFPWLAFRSPLSGDRTAPLHPDVRRALDLDTYVADQYRAAGAGVEHHDGESAEERHMRTMSNLHVTRFVRWLLDRKDRISMAVGLEVRVPFCDHRLVEYVYNAPWALKAFDGREKSLLRHAAAHVLPESVMRRLKAPYPSTQDPGYAAALQQQAKDLLAERNHPILDLIDQDWLTTILDRDVTLPSDARRGIDRVLDLYHWIDIYRPTIEID